METKDFRTIGPTAGRYDNLPSYQVLIKTKDWAPKERKPQMSDNVDNYVVYGVWHPLKGWLDNLSPGKGRRRPTLMSRHKEAKALAAKANAQLVTFDVIPSLRSWPAGEPKPTETP